MLDDVGVIVGRFQVHQLHDGHLDLIEHVVKRHRRVVIFLGLSPVKGTRSNPLDFESRKQMILQRFRGVTVLYAKDQPDDRTWSQILDTMIEDTLRPGQKAVLYGGRDGFTSRYTGKFPTEVLEAKRIVSGSEIRKELASYPRDCPNFRAGAIWSAFNRYPTAFPTVDVAVVDGTKLLLGKKTEDSKLRFIGGFVSPEDLSLEDAALREVFEEAGGIEISELTYIGSARIDDWRYRSESDKIMTTLFKADFVFGRAVGGDDLAEVRWVELEKLSRTDLKHMIVETHWPLVDLLCDHLGWGR